MTSIKVEIKDATVTPAHHMVTVWAGPNPEHRAACGVLTMTPEESAELIVRIEAGESNLGQVTPEVARHVLWHYNATGRAEPGAFTQHLMAAIQVADSANRPRMRAQFPAYVEAMRWAAGWDDGIERLQRIAAGASTVRTQDEIVARIREVADEDAFGFRVEVLVMCLDFEHARPFLAESATKDQWTRRDAEQAAREYYAFAVGQIRDHRGLSAHRSVEKLQEFAWLLGRLDVIAAMEAADYSQYGAPKVKAFGAGLGLAWPDEPELIRMAAGEPCAPGCHEGCGR